MSATAHPTATPGSTPATAPLRFAGGWTLSFVPLVVFLAGCVTYFVVFKAFDLSALAMAAFVGLLAGSVACRENPRYWDAAVRGISSPASVTIVLILFVIGMYSELVKTSGVAGGFAWLAETLGITGAGFTVFTFLAVCTVAVSTGSSIGTMFTAFPVFFAAGPAVGAEPAVLAGAIVSGAIFGDNLAPVSDTTIISASTQSFRTRPGTADVGGVVRSRAPYALVAAAFSTVVFALLGGAADGAARAPELAGAGAPRGLWMLLPVVAVLVVAVRTRDIFRAVAVGLVLGTLTALAAGLISPAQVLSVSEGAPAGYLVTGTTAVLGTVALVIGVFGVMGVLVEAGVLDRLTSALRSGRLGRTPAGAEVAIAVGSTVTTVLFGGVNSASMIAFGPVADEIGGRAGLHPYRRSNVLDCFAMGLGCVVPFLSAFLFIGATLVEGNGAPVSAGALFAGTVYPLALTAVMAVCVLTGWGRRFEAAGGAAVKQRPVA
ncbi:Na+/H+ antiporter NhaC family protein [Kineococcus sp. SYSU DK002]|uniref:Na+/H+ antiporter NhaC family protein n=1 Tax=Kineococcus sp. SYSU DK002 TaxID=3383123 RepID=UPI003D7EB4F2